MSPEEKLAAIAFLHTDKRQDQWNWDYPFLHDMCAVCGEYSPCETFVLATGATEADVDRSPLDRYLDLLESMEPDAVLQERIDRMRKESDVRRSYDT